MQSIPNRDTSVEGNTANDDKDAAEIELQNLAEHKDTDNMDMDKKSEAYSSNKRQTHGCIKYVSLVVLTLQNAVLGLSMRYAATRNTGGQERFSNFAAVLMAEVLKLLICMVLVMQESRSVQKGAVSMYTTVILNYKDTLRVGVPAFLYVIQNNLLYISAANLDVATYQVTYQLKLLTTAFFAVVVLKRVLKRWQWLALAILAGGVALVQLNRLQSLASALCSKIQRALRPQLSSTRESRAASEHEQSRVLGFSTALAACFISGFAGIYFEKVLKGSDVSVWMRNVQMSLLSVPIAVATYAAREGGLTHVLRGFDAFIWYLVALQAAGGLVVAVVVKYADNILKGFATSVAIVVSCIAAMYLFDFRLTAQFAVGTLLVISSIFLYGYVPKKTQSRSLV